MRRDQIDEELKEAVFGFLYRFSRFEFCLKANGLIRCGPRNVAQPDWKTFIEHYSDRYSVDGALRRLLDDAPNVQIVDNNGSIHWAPLQFEKNQSELSKAVLAVKAIRNNLFHGGKHNAEGWDDPKRSKALLSCGVRTLDSFVSLAGWQHDYERLY